MRNKVLLYPFDQQFLPLLETKCLPEEIEVVACVSPHGWGFTGRDVGDVACRPSLGMVVTDDFEGCLQDVDGVVFCQYQKYLDREKSLLPRIHSAIAQNKNIICCVYLSDTELLTFRTEAANSNVKFTYYGNENLDVPLNFEAILEIKELQPISTTIVAVSSLIEKSGKLDVQLKFAAFLRSLGYSVSLVTSKTFTSFIGEHPVPAFLFSRERTESEKIFLYNAYVKFIEETEQPDIIIIAIPGVLLPTGPKETDWFGITAYEISRAVTPDASFLLTHYENFKLSHLSDLVTMLDNRFSLSIDSIIMNNIMVDFAEEKHISYFPLKVMSSDPLFTACEGINVFGVHNLHTAFTHIVERLVGYSDIRAI